MVEEDTSIAANLCAGASTLEQLGILPSEQAPESDSDAEESSGEEVKYVAERNTVIRGEEGSYVVTTYTAGDDFPSLITEMR
eukprot:4365403-Prorocentrum_lima.AAC.1